MADKASGGSMAETMTLAWWALRLAYRSSPKVFVGSVLLDSAAAVMPALQFFVIRRFVSAYVSAESTLDLTLWTVFAGLMVGGSLSLLEIAGRVRAIVAQRSSTFGATLVSKKLSEIPPAQVPSSSVARLTRQAREAVNNGSLTQYQDAITASLASVVTAVSLALALWQLSWIAALLVAATILPTFWIYRRAASLIAMQWTENSDHVRSAYYREDLLTMRDSAVELASLNARGWVSGSAASERRSSCRLDNDIELKTMRYESIGFIATSVLICLAVLVIVMSGDVDGISLTSAFIAVLSGLMALRAIGYSTGMLFVETVAILRLREFLQLPASAPSAAVATSASVIDVRGLSVRYPGSEVSVVSEVDIRVERGEIIAIVGPNGAGKTTLVTAIVGLLDAERGSVVIDGNALDNQEFSRRSPYFGLLVQNFGRFDFTIRENLQLGVGGNSVSDSTMWRSLEFSGADQFVRELSEGLSTQLGEQWDGTGLSGGQWQRLALARLWLRNAPIWILDEPTSAVDAEAEESLFRLLRESSGERMTIVISHRASTLRRMDRIYVMDEGRIVESGTYEELVSAEGRFCELFEGQLFASV